METIFDLYPIDEIDAEIPSLAMFTELEGGLAIPNRDTCGSPFVIMERSGECYYVIPEPPTEW